MGRRRSIAACSLLLAWPACAVIVDRVAVSVGNSVITESQIELAIRVTAFLNGETADFGPEAKRQTADRLVDQLLVRNELVLSRYPLPPSNAWKRLFDRIEKQRFHGSEAELNAALAKYRLTEQELKKQFEWQITFLRFVDARFRPGVQITDQEVQSYFEKTVAPAAQKAHPGEQVSLDDYRDRIERILTQRRVDQQLDQWLKETRARTSIKYREEAFQ
jgi:peptidyl-prolyl cis-trans isomerase SurA